MSPFRQQLERHLADVRGQRVHRADQRRSTIRPIRPRWAGSINYTFFEPLPFIVLAQLVVGQEFMDNTGGQTQFVTNRLYIQPGVLIEFNRGIRAQRPQPRGQPQRRIAGVHQRQRPDPTATVRRRRPANFVDESAADPKVLFTTIYDDTTTAPPPSCRSRST